MTLRPLPLSLTLALLWGAVQPAAGQANPAALAAIKGLKCLKQAGAVLVSYRIEGALGPEFRSTLESGLPVTFVHKLSVVRRRSFFFDKTLTRLTLEVTVSLDTLTQRYTLTRKADGNEVETVTTDKREEMEAWMTEIRGVVIPLPEESRKGALELRVKTAYESNYYVLWVLPWSLSALDDKECR